ncbi:MAG: hypothetical protein FWG39_00835 [Alphaproteobacteria bacterium]|nr:hypothetical protein [Alphaproteobacteria bacterium]
MAVMRDDEKMLQYGMGLMITAFLMMAVLQVCFRAQERARARMKSQIVRTQQEYAAARAHFSGQTRPDTLRVIVSEMFPKFETIGFKKNISANEIPIK